MGRVLTTSVSLAAVLFAFTAAEAGEVTVKGVHLCCGQCVKLVATALGKTDGVSGAACDRKAKTISFTAADDEAAGAGIAALSRAGFHGKATHGDKKLKFPASGAKEGDKADAITLNGVHLCCGNCVKYVRKALKAVDGVSGAAFDRKARNVSLTGSGIDVAAAVAALNKAGFHGTVAKKK